jgi:hypothetical protein
MGHLKSIMLVIGVIFTAVGGREEQGRTNFPTNKYRKNASRMSKFPTKQMSQKMSQ